MLACGLWALVLLSLAATAWLDHLLRRAVWLPKSRSWLLSCEFVGEILGRR